MPLPFYTAKRVKKHKKLRALRPAWSVQLEVFATVQNLFDKIAPLDPLTYGATGYNPLDYAGAAGRFISAGAKYKF